MGPKRSLVLVVAVLGSLVVTVPPSYACPKDATKCSESGDIQITAQGFGFQSTDVTPRGSKSGGINISPFSKGELNDSTVFGTRSSMAFQTLDASTTCSCAG